MLSYLWRGWLLVFAFAPSKSSRRILPRTHRFDADGNLLTRFMNASTKPYGRISLLTAAALWTLLFLFAHAASAQTAQETTPANLKIAFIGDQSLGPNAVAVLNLIKAEGAQAVMHSGDFDYTDNPAAWDAQINRVLGADFPYFATIGNHDELAWAKPDGYQH